MKTQAVDHLGRPRRGPADAAWKILLRLVVGLGSGVGACGLGLLWVRSSYEPWYVVVPPVTVLALLAAILLLLERQGYRTGYVLIIGAFAAGMAAVLVAYGMGLGSGLLSMPT